MSENKITKFLPIIRENGERIAKLINSNKMLDSQLIFEIHPSPKDEIFTSFFLESHPTTRAGISFFIPYEGPFKDTLCVTGKGVNSSLPGTRVGSFLFNLNVGLALSVNARAFYLNNFTDEPHRAAQGIYELFKVNTVDGTHGNNARDFHGLSLEDQLVLSEGEMILVADPSSKKEWKEKIKKIGTQIQNRNLGSPWIQPVESKMVRFVTQISQFREFSGGRKMRRKRRFSQKTTKKKGKIGKKSKKKKAKTKIKISFLKF